MKKITIILAIFLYTSINAQVAIEKETLRSTSSIMEFNDMAETGGVAKGIILPVLSNTSTVKPGALWVDGTTKKVMYKKATENVAMTDAYSSLIVPTGNTAVNDGVIISDGSVTSLSTDPAVLKLESNQAALVLPHVNDVTKDISNPEAGTIVYDRKSRSLAIFNGEFWFFWN